jgi:hypothetical protein
MYSTTIISLKVLSMLSSLKIYIEREARLANCRLKCVGILNQVEFGHSKVFENKTEELPLLFALKLFQIMFLEVDFL